MSAFAAIVSRDGSHAGVDAVAAVLAACTGRKAHSFTSDSCTLLMAPLHAWDPIAPVVCEPAGLAAAGQVMLEESAALRRALDVSDDGAELAIVAAAFLHWGADAPARMQGEYAFAAWQARDRTLTCARDGLGIRVLYVGESSGTIVVSNVLDAVVAHPAISSELDHAALVRFLADGRPTATGATPYKAVRLVPPGHTLSVPVSGRATLRRHWQPPAVRQQSATDAASLVRGYREVLRRSVRERIGGRRGTIFLSGGIDSTTIAAAAVDVTAALRAVTFRYRDVDMDEEVRLATAVANRLAIPLEIVDADAHPPLEAERAGLGAATLIDEPMLSNWRAGLERAAQHSTLALYGEDGDALFAPPAGAALAAAQSIPSVLAATARLVAQERTLPYLGLRVRERLGLWTAPVIPAARWLTPDACRLLEGVEDDHVLGSRPQPIDGTAAERRTWAHLLRNVPCDFAVSLSPDVTRQRLALTLPLMDSRVVGYVKSVPPIPWCHRKRLARAAFVDRLPAAVLERPKTAVSGDREAMVGAWRRLRPDTGAPLRALAATGWVDARRWHAALHGDSAAEAMAAWRALMLDAWLERAVRGGAPCTR